MPMPKPNSGEAGKDFMSRCMGDPVMRREFPDSSQRAAVCKAQAAKRKSDDGVFRKLLKSLERSF